MSTLRRAKGEVLNMWVELISRVILLFLSAFLLFGCENGYQKFYTPLNVSNYSRSVLPSTGDPVLRASSGDRDKDIDALFFDGYVPIGYSSFSGPLESVDKAIEQAKKVGAKYVVVNSQYLST
jgi:hypothetical protein